MTTDLVQQDGFPLDDMQMAYYVGEQPGLPLATTARFLREMMFPPMDAQRIEDAWNVLIRRHDMLRVIMGANGRQRVLNDVPRYRIERRDLAAADDATVRLGQQALHEAMWEHRLPLDAWPQFDLRILVEPAGVRLMLRFNLWTLDAISMQILLAELLALCDAPGLTLPPAHDTFRRYMEQRAATCDTRGARAREYWARRALTLPSGPELPLDKGAGEIARKPTFRHLSASLPAVDWQRFEAIAQQQRVTPTFAVIAAYAGALARWGRSRHFTITVLLSKRPFADGEVEQVVGNFGTTLLLEVDLREPESFADLARAVQKQFWKDVAHIDVSGVEVAREMNRAQGLGLNLVAPVTFTSMMASNNLSDEQQAALKRLRHVGSRLDVPQVLLDHQVAEEPQGDLTMNWDYVEDAFAPGVIDDMFDAFVDNLRRLAEGEQAWTDAQYQVPLQARQQQAWDTLNATRRDYPDLLLDDLVETAVRAHPQNAAVICGGRHLTYAALWAASGALAGRLAAAGVSEGLVAVALPKSTQQLIAVLAVVRAGIAYVPIDPSLPPQRQNELLARSAAVAVLTTPVLAQTRAWPASLPVLAVDTEQTADDTAEVVTPVRTRSSRDTAYVIFTSGSTGTPKGVVIDHHGAVNTILDINRRLAVGAQDRVLALSSLSFDLSVYDIFGLLATGGAVVVPTSAELGNPAEWARLVHDTGITLWNSVPALFQLAVDAARDLGTPMPTLRHVMMSGDWIPLPLPEQGWRVAPAARIHSLGGATEVSIWSVIHEIGALDPQWPTIPYGRPLGNQQAYVLDDRFQLCPLWKAGELYLAGEGVARGYHGDAERTRERFLTHVIDGQVLYRTGDLARLRPSGDLEFLGRCDHQIKLRGFRIELGEIEAALTARASVSGAVVKALGGADADKQLVAFVVTEAHAQVAPEGLRAALADALPAYMIPSAIHVLDALPLTPNGKVDHAALTEMHASSAADPGTLAWHGAEDSTADSETARALAPLWAELLGIGTVGMNDAFFALGGTSFQALQLVSKIRERFSVTLTLDAFTSTLTLRTLAELIDRKPGVCAAPAAAQPVVLLRRPDADEAEATLSLFCIHAVGGTTHAYIPLGAHLPPGVRMFGIQRTDATPAEAALSSIEALADYYADEIRRAAPTGPVALLGWSMGAAVAVEAARRLAASGREVRMAALIDPYYLPADATRPPTRAADSAPTLEAFCRDLVEIAGSSYVSPDRALAHRAVDDDTRFSAYIADLIDQAILPADTPVAHLRRVFDTFSRNLDALYAYRPSACDIDVLVLRATRALPPDTTVLRPWTPAARTLDEHSLDGDHFSIMRAPLIERIASLITDRLALERA